MHTSHYPSLVYILSNAIYFNVTKRKTLLWDYHYHKPQSAANLYVPIHPLFYLLYKWWQCFAPLVSFHFYIFRNFLTALPLLPINTLHSLLPSTSLHLLVPSAAILLSCSCTKVVPGLLQISLSSQHWAASSEGLFLLPDVAGQTIRIGHLWIRHLKPQSYSSSTYERNSCCSDFKISTAWTAFTT